jgi:hypothetical protein
MTKPVRLAREARDELHDAAQRYGEVRPELREEFLDAIDEALTRLVRMARHLGSPPGADPSLGVRRVFVERCRLWSWMSRVRAPSYAGRAVSARGAQVIEQRRRQAQGMAQT